MDPLSAEEAIRNMLALKSVSMDVVTRAEEAPAIPSVTRETVTVRPSQMEVAEAEVALFGKVIPRDTAFLTVTDHDSLVHLQASMMQGMPPDARVAMEASLLRHIARLPVTDLPNLSSKPYRLPARTRYTIDLWIDEATRLIHQLVWIRESVREGEVLHRNEDRRAFSRFNEAELPG